MSEFSGPQFAYLVISLAFFGVGLILNVCVLVASFKSKLFETRNAILIGNLAGCEFVLSLCMMPVLLTNAAQSQWTGGHSVCDFQGFVLVTLSCETVLLLSAIAADRFLVIVKGVPGQQLKSPFAGVVVGTWLFSLVVGLLPVASRGQAHSAGTYVQQPATFYCSADWTKPGWAAGALIVVGVCCCVIAISYLRIWHYHHKTITSVASHVRPTVKRENRVSRKMLILICSFVLCWVPYVVRVIVAASAPEEVSVLFDGIAFLFLSFNVLLNPLIYVLLDTRYRYHFAVMCRLTDSECCMQCCAAIGGSTFQTPRSKAVSPGGAPRVSVSMSRVSSRSSISAPPSRLKDSTPQGSSISLMDRASNRSTQLSITAPGGAVPLLEPLPYLVSVFDSKRHSVEAPPTFAVFDGNTSTPSTESRTLDDVVSLSSANSDGGSALSSPETPSAAGSPVNMHSALSSPEVRIGRSPASLNQGLISQPNSALVSPRSIGDSPLSGRISRTHSRRNSGALSNPSTPPVRYHGHKYTPQSKARTMTVSPPTMHTIIDVVEPPECLASNIVVIHSAPTAVSVLSDASLSPNAASAEQQTDDVSAQSHSAASRFLTSIWSTIRPKHKATSVRRHSDSTTQLTKHESECPTSPNLSSPATVPSLPAVEETTSLTCQKQSPEC